MPIATPRILNLKPKNYETQNKSYLQRPIKNNL